MSGGGVLGGLEEAFILVVVALDAGQCVLSSC